MVFFDLLLIAFGLSMDAFAVAVCKGLAMPRMSVKHAVVIALFFGAFQALMPTLGWLLGTRFASFATSASHWIAFALLAFIGVKMLWDVFRGDNEEDAQGACDNTYRLNIKELLLLAIATSIDALAVGITFAFLQVDVFLSVGAIGVITFAVSLAGVAIGHVFGSRMNRSAQVIGGAVLIAIGVKILLEGLGVVTF